MYKKKTTFTAPEVAASEPNKASVKASPQAVSLARYSNQSTGSYNSYNNR